MDAVKKDYFIDWELARVPDNIPVDEEHFPDKAFRDWILKQPFCKDGVLTPENLNREWESKTIAVNGKGIKDLTGIEYFTGLESLLCSDNNISKLDLSKNGALILLYCNNTALTELDLRKNTSLEYLSCYNNRLTSLDVSGLTSLSELECANNSLSILELSSNSNLVSLCCSNNNLTDLDLSHNSELQYLYCNENELTSLDISGCKDLERIDCRKNALSSLDVSKNPHLFDVIKTPHPQKLSCDDNVKVIKAAEKPKKHKGMHR